MIALNLLRYTQDEFEGSCVTLRGRSYHIGSKFRDNDQGYAHYLINGKSNLCLHAIQIRKEYQSDPKLALISSQKKERATAALRSEMRLKQPGVQIPILSVIQAHGGSFELHEARWCVLGDTEGQAEWDTVQEAHFLKKNNDYNSAINLLQGVLEHNNKHTEALCELARCYREIDDNIAALEAVTKLVWIEPNSVYYLSQQLIQVLNSTRRHDGLALFEAMRQKYPHVDDFNIYGIEGYLNCGVPEQAKQLVDLSHLGKVREEELNTAISSACEVKQAYRKLESQVSESHNTSKKGSTRNLLQQLQALHQRYPADPFIQVNLGLTQGRGGQLSQARENLCQATSGLPRILAAHSVMNAAFYSAQLQEWDAALIGFDRAMQLLGVYGEKLEPMYIPGTDAQVGVELKAIDIPGAATWIFEQGSIVESAKFNVVDLFKQTVTQCSDSSLIAPAIKRLEALYKESISIYGTATGEARPSIAASIKSWFGES